MSSHHDTSLSALSSTTPTGTDLNDKGIGSGSNTTTGDTTGNTTGNTTDSTTQHEHGNSNMGGPTHGSSTGPAGAAPGYSSSTQHDHAAAEPTKTSGEGLGAGMGKTGENVGQGARDIYKGVHVRSLPCILDDVSTLDDG